MRQLFHSGNLSLSTSLDLFCHLNAAAPCCSSCRALLTSLTFRKRPGIYIVLDDNRHFFFFANNDAVLASLALFAVLLLLLLLRYWLLWLSGSARAVRLLLLLLPTLSMRPHAVLGGGMLHDLTTTAIYSRSRSSAATGAMADKIVDQFLDQLQLTLMSDASCNRGGAICSFKNKSVAMLERTHPQHQSSLFYTTGLLMHAMSRLHELLQCKSHRSVTLPSLATLHER